MRCMVKGCKKEQKNSKDSKNAFFLFPRNKEKLAKWVEFCNQPKRQFNRKTWRICMDHFKTKDICTDLEYLMGNAVRKPQAIPCEKSIETSSSKELAKQASQLGIKSLSDSLFKQDFAETTVLHDEHVFINLKNKPFAVAENLTAQIKAEPPNNCTRYLAADVKNEPFDETENLVTQRQAEPPDNNILTLEIFDNVKIEPLTVAENLATETEPTSTQTSSKNLKSLRRVKYAPDALKNQRKQIQTLEYEIQAMKKENQKLKVDLFCTTKKQEYKIDELKKELYISEFKCRQIENKFKKIFNKRTNDAITELQ